MTYKNSESVEMNLKLSVDMIRDFITALPQEQLTAGLLEKKQRAAAALEHLDALFKHSHVLDASIDPDRCGPKPVIPAVF